MKVVINKCYGGFSLSYEAVKRLALKIVEIPAGTEYTIEEYDGIEHIAQVHNTWG